MSDTPEITADRPEPVPESPPKRPDLWIVLAYDQVIEVWATFGPRDSSGLARDMAAKLGPRWTHRRIVRIPGEG